MFTEGYNRAANFESTTYGEELVGGISAAFQDNITGMGTSFGNDVSREFTSNFSTTSPAGGNAPSRQGQQVQQAIAAKTRELQTAPAIETLRTDATAGAAKYGSPEKISNQIADRKQLTQEIAQLKAEISAPAESAAPMARNPDSQTLGGAVMQEANPITVGVEAGLVKAAEVVSTSLGAPGLGTMVAGAAVGFKTAMNLGSAALSNNEPVTGQDAWDALASLPGDDFDIGQFHLTEQSLFDVKCPIYDGEDMVAALVGLGRDTAEAEMALARYEARHGDGINMPSAPNTGTGFAIPKGMAGMEAPGAPTNAA